MMLASPHSGFVESTRSGPVRESAPGADRQEARILRPKGRPECRLALRSANSTDGEALQTYVRGLSLPSRYNRFLGAISELPPTELTRALAANGRDTLTLLLAPTAEDRDTVVGEARVALSCAERAGEFAMSIADGWRRFGVGSALLEEIERRAAVEGVEWLFGDVLRTNEGMIALARGHGFSLGPGLEGRLLRVHRRLKDAVPDLPCRKWNEIAAVADSSFSRLPQ